MVQIHDEYTMSVAHGANIWCICGIALETKKWDGSACFKRQDGKLMTNYGGKL
jgi:hypothetical protein